MLSYKDQKMVVAVYSRYSAGPDLKIFMGSSCEKGVGRQVESTSKKKKKKKKKE